MAVAHDYSHGHGIGRADCIHRIFLSAEQMDLRPLNQGGQNLLAALVMPGGLLHHIKDASDLDVQGEDIVVCDGAEGQCCETIDCHFF